MCGHVLREEREKEIRQLKMNSEIMDVQSVGRTSGCEEHYIFKRLTGVFSGKKKKSPYLAPGTKQSI